MVSFNLLINCALTTQYFLPFASHYTSINISEFCAVIGYSASSDVIWYQQSADRILIRFSELKLLQQSARCHIKPVSQSTVSVMKKKLFKNVEVKASNNNFSRCSECDFLQDCISKYPWDRDEWATLVNDKTKHINYQNACRRLYHGWSSNSVDSPTEFLCIIHDKMDHTKSAIPRMQRSTKATSGLGQIPISVTGMLTHGHGDRVYAHYSTTYWPGDSNFTISSICRVLRALERPPVKDLKELFIVPLQNSFFEALLHGKSRCSTLIPPRTSMHISATSQSC